MANEWENKPLVLLRDRDGVDGLHIVIDGIDHDEDMGVRLYVPSDPAEAEAFLERLVSIYNDTAPRRVLDTRSSHVER